MEELVKSESLPSFHNPVLFAKPRISGQISHLGLAAEIFTLRLSEAPVGFTETSLNILHFRVFFGIFGLLPICEGFRAV